MTRNISGSTKICGIIGDPVEHTMSPSMHNAAFNELGLDYVYVAFRVKPDDLSKAVNGMRALGIVGLNVTIPHKINIIPLLDRLDPLAEKIGAVNTVVNESGVLAGYNTDATGFLRAITERGISPVGMNVAVLGAGGASRAISLVLAENKADITILNRTSGMDRAVILAASVSGTAGTRVEALELNENNLEEVLKKADIVVNTTSVGMTPDTGKSPVPPGLLRSGLVVYDIVYNPVRTRLLRDAEAAGAVIIGGIDMLVWQGAMAFEKWTGKEPPLDLMKKEAMKYL
ncbi:MAG: shikimate dehydrogenase [Dehalococcoidales bacterium]|nr:shikimate dehydrogenase [Dehalococcoidales bacterium]